MILPWTRYIDDLLGRAWTEGAQQVVLLGAGYDCRAVRLEALKDVRVFEVGHPKPKGSRWLG